MVSRNAEWTGILSSVGFSLSVCLSICLSVYLCSEYSERLSDQLAGHQSAIEECMPNADNINC